MLLRDQDEKEEEEDEEAAKILLLSSNGRSGSSYLSELLTPEMTGSVLFFEPLQWLETPPQLRKDELRAASSSSAKWRRSTSSTSSREKLRMVEAMLECHFDDYEDVLLSRSSRERVFGRAFPLVEEAHAKLLEEYMDICLKSKLKLVKSIRLHLDEILDVLKFDEFNHPTLISTKVLLLRDPRGVLNSMLKSPFRSASHPSKLCGHVLRDLGSVGALRMRGVDVLVLRYEDLVEDAAWQLEDVLDFLGRAHLRDRVMREVERHISVDGSGSRRGSNPEFFVDVRYYFDTHRPPSYVHDAWKDELPRDALDRMQAHQDCRKVFDWMNYDLLE